MKGRPLRFLAAVLGGWAAVRLVMLWPATAPGGDVARRPGPVPRPTPSFEPLPAVLADVRPFLPSVTR